MEVSNKEVAGISQPILIVHKDHELDPLGVNAGAEMATLWLARTLANLGQSVYVAAQLPEAILSQSQDGKWSDTFGVGYIDLGKSFDTQSVVEHFSSSEGINGFHLLVASRAQALLESRNNSKIISRTFISHEPSAGALGVKPNVIAEVADSIICVSEAQKSALIEAGCAADKINVIPNGADLSLFQPGEIASRNFNRIVFVGALVVDKGIHLLVEAFAQLKARHPQLILDVYGSAAMWGRENYFDIEAIASQVPDLNLHGAVGQDVIAEAFQTAGVLALPSIYFDSFPLTAVEAQVSGLPVIGSKNGGMKEIIVDSETGILLEEVSSATIANAIERIVGNPELGKRMSEAALRDIRPKFSWEEIAKEFLNSIGSGQVSNQAKPETKVGILTTHNQKCGLATYADYLISGLSEEVTILAESVEPSELIEADGENVVRCWTRDADTLSDLLAAVDASGINVLHLNCHYRFFNPNVIRETLSQLKESGVSVIAHVHNPFTIDQSLRELVTGSAQVIVHTPENKLEVIANGADAERVSVIEHGVKIASSHDRAQARAKANISESEKAVVCFGFVQPHKGFDEVIDSVSQLRTSIPNIKLYIVGGPHEEDSQSLQYFQALQQLVVTNGLSENIEFVSGFVPAETVESYLVAADAVVMNYRSNYYEASGALATALGCYAPVITSAAPAFARFGDTVLHVTTGFPLTLAIQQVLTNEELNQALRLESEKFAKCHAWENASNEFSQLYTALTPKKSAAAPIEISVPEDSDDVNTGAGLRILMQNRANALTHRGGDTVVMEEVAEGLRKLGVQVDFDLEGTADLRAYDIIHLHNFATPEITEAFARRAKEANVPYVVTTMYEDLPKFYNQMFAFYEVLQAYVNANQPKEKWAELEKIARQAEASPRWENAWTANNAAALIATGEREKLSLLRDYPDTNRVDLYSCGCNLGHEDITGDLFRETYNLNEFILCVGRLETRKNQLGLLKALEDSTIPLVFATGGFTYQPEYEQVCRNFKRAGETIFLGRLDADMLASAYAAAKVHALPSWYELPGIVSMEAARRGTNIVVADLGTPKDYFGDCAYYCLPYDPESIYNAVMAAFYTPSKAGLVDTVLHRTWDNAARQVLQSYKRVLSSSPKLKRENYELPEWNVNSEQDTIITTSIDEASQTAEEASDTVRQIADMAKGSERATIASPEDAQRAKAANDREIAGICDEGDRLARNGELEGARAAYQDAILKDPTFARAYRGSAVIELQLGRIEDAEEDFRDALNYDPKDHRSLAGLGTCFWVRGDRDEAFNLYMSALSSSPGDTAILLQLLNAAYVLGRLEELERALLEYLKVNPDEVEMRYCLAGCLFKQQKFQQAAHAIEQVLEREPFHKEGAELKELVAEQLAKVATVQPTEISVPTMTHKLLNENDALIQEIEDAKKEGDYEEALILADKVRADQTAREDQKALATVLKAESLAFLGRFDESDSCFESLLGDRVQKSRALTGRGVVATALEDFVKAEEFFNQAVEARASNDSAIAGLAICAMKRNDHDTAWSKFTEALSINSENMRALLGIVQIGYTGDRIKRVEEYLKSYLGIHPADLSILYSYAGCLFAQERFDEAESELQKILIFDSQHKLACELLEEIEQKRKSLAPSSA